MSSTNYSNRKVKRVIDELMLRFPPYQDFGPYITTRVRLARNVEDVPFPVAASPQQKKQFAFRVSQFFENRPDFKIIMLSALTEAELKILAEKHLIPYDFLRDQRGSMVAFTEDLSSSVLVNEEDHFRIQVIVPGLHPEEAFEQAVRIEREIDREFKLAYDREFGYLTSCPSNLGTGLRISVMMHLPVLSIKGKIGELTEYLNKYRFVARGTFGEGSNPFGHMYQVSNQATLGLSEDEIMRRTKKLAELIVQEEMEIRENVMKEDKIFIEDLISRSLAVCKSAKRMDYEEAAYHISIIKLGLETGLVENIKVEALMEMFFMLRTGHLSRFFGRDRYREEEELKERAKIISTALKGCKLVD